MFDNLFQTHFNGFHLPKANEDIHLILEFIALLYYIDWISSLFRLNSIKRPWKSISSDISLTNWVIWQCYVQCLVAKIEYVCLCAFLCVCSKKINKKLCFVNGVIPKYFVAISFSRANRFYLMNWIWFFIGFDSRIFMWIEGLCCSNQCAASSAFRCINMSNAFLGNTNTQLSAENSLQISWAKRRNVEQTGSLAANCKWVRKCFSPLAVTNSFVITIISLNAESFIYTAHNYTWLHIVSLSLTPYSSVTFTHTVAERRGKKKYLFYTFRSKTKQSWIDTFRTNPKTLHPEKCEKLKKLLSFE